MGKILEYFGRQCGNPNGLVGKIMTFAMNKVNKKMYHAIIEEICLKKNDAYLEIGFGNGYMIHQVYNVIQCKICGIDLSDDMLKIASKKNSNGIKNGDVHLAIGDCCNLQFDDNIFDVVTTMNTIYFWNDTLKGMQEIYRVLKPGGVFINAVLTKESLEKVAYTKNVFKFFKREDYAKIGEMVGFSYIKFKKINRHSFLIICRK